jgi:hypothetical protein
LVYALLTYLLYKKRNLLDKHKCKGSALIRANYTQYELLRVYLYAQEDNIVDNILDVSENLCFCVCTLSWLFYLHILLIYCSSAALFANNTYYPLKIVDFTLPNLWCKEPCSFWDRYWFPMLKVLSLRLGQICCRVFISRVWTFIPDTVKTLYIWGVQALNHGLEPTDFKLHVIIFICHLSCAHWLLKQIPILQLLAEWCECCYNQEIAENKTKAESHTRN